MYSLRCPVTRFISIALVAAYLMCGALAQAHDLSVSKIDALFFDDGRFRVEIQTQEDAALIPMPEGDDPKATLRDMRAALLRLGEADRELSLADLRFRVSTKLEVRFDDNEFENPEISFPDQDIEGTRELGELHLLGNIVQVSGRRPGK